MNIVSAIKDAKLFRNYLEDPRRGIKLKSWRNWLTCLRVLYGQSLNKNKRDIVFQCTGRNIHKLPSQGFDEALILTGRRSGKSKIAGLIAAFEAVLSGREKGISNGEIPVVCVISPTRRQTTIVRSYIRAALSSPMLEAEIISEDRETIELSNGVAITVLTGDFRAVRGYTLICCIIDEAAFFGYSEESKVRSDSELVIAVRPALATVGGKLICISTPYARKGHCFNTHKKYFGNDDGDILVWNAPSLVMNRATLSKSVVDKAMQEDRSAALSEYMAQFRDDVGIFLPRELIEACVVKGRFELLPKRDFSYTAFADLSGGRSDSATLSIAHKCDGKTVLDKTVEYQAPFIPTRVIENMCEVLQNHKISRVFGDAYAGDFVTSAFLRGGVHYIKSDKSKSQIYLESIPIICSQACELLDNEKVITQFSNLQRRTRSGGMDAIDHIAGTKDDMANSVAGAIVFSNTKMKIGGVW